MIRLRPYKPGDAWNLLEWWKDAGEEEFLMWSRGEFSFPLTIEELDGYFARWCLQETGGFPVTALNGDGTPVGHFLVKETDWETGTARLGFLVTAPGIRGTGKEFVNRILDYVFCSLGMKRAVLTVFAENRRAMACYEACGFRRVSFLPDGLEYKGRTFGVYEMEASAHE